MEVAARFFCTLCNVGQGISTEATPSQRQTFDRFCDEHRGCAAELAIVQRVNRTKRTLKGAT